MHRMHTSRRMDRKSSFSGDVLPISTQSPNRRRPLIEQCTNEWQNNPKYRDHLQSDETFPDDLALTVHRVWAVIKAPKFQRLVGVLCVIAILLLFLWRNFLSDLVIENRAAWEMMNAETEARHGMIFGTNKRVQFSGVTHISTMDAAHLPRNSKSGAQAAKDKRLIFIGDIHGCMNELEALLAKVKYVADKDHIIALGDMINKGPNSLEVIDFLMENGASCVRGNHEDRILLVANDATGNALKAGTDGTDKTIETEAARKIRKERELATSLSPEQLDWLNACPIILRVGELGSHGEIVAVHGGLVPGIALEEQDPMSVMNMRIVNLTTHMPSSEAQEEGSVPWADFWNKYQKLMSVPKTIFFNRPSTHDFKHTTVVYGHDAKRGLQIDTYTKGLDSGCVKGGKLTAWVVGDRGKNEIVQIKSRNRLD